MEYRHLFSELSIGPMRLKNRICMPAMHLGFEEGGEVTDRLIEFYVARARGGAALITVGGCSIDLPGGGAIMMSLFDDRFIPGLKRLTDAVHAAGAKIGAQLFHSGRYSYSFMFGIEPVAPSPIPSKLTRQMPHELTVDEIKAIVAAFGDAAERAERAGFDMVEPIGSAGYLICQFLSPMTNHRTDGYGGSIENRMRFAREVFGEVKRRVGPQTAVMVRMAGNDFMGDHAHRDEILTFAKMYEESGVHAINVTGGWHESIVPQITGHLPAGGYSYLAREVKERVRIPVLASNRLGNPILAEEVLRLGFADAINMGRPLIADPEIANKAMAGREAHIRPCISCNQGCLDNVFSAQPIECTVNCMAGREQAGDESKASRAKKVAVIGGGPTGCEAARVAAMRGHKVTLFEKSDRLGGQINDAGAAPGKACYNELVRFHRAELGSLGVSVRLNSSVTPEALKPEGFEAAIVATGSQQITLPIPGANLPHVCQARAILERRRDWTDDVVIIGSGGVGLDTAHLIAEKDTISGDMVKFLLDNDAEPVDTLRRLSGRARRRITVVEILDRPGTGIGRSTKWVILNELKRLGVKILLSAKVTEIREREVAVEQEGRVFTIPATTVVLAAGARSETALIGPLKSFIPEVHVAGDAVSPRLISNAISEGAEAGRKV